MSRYRTASFQKPHCGLAKSSKFSNKLRKTMPLLALAAFCLAPPFSNGQAAPSAANSAQAAKACDGQKPASADASQDTATNEDGTGSHLKLSMKPRSSDASDAEGQFCKRTEHDSLHPSASQPKTTETQPASQSDAPPPIAELKDGKLTVRANGQDFAVVLDAVRSATGIAIDMPAESQPEAVFMNLGPVPAKSALMALLDGTRYNYVMIGSQDDPQSVNRLILSERSGGAGPAMVASVSSEPAAAGPELYGGPGFHPDEDAQNAEPAVPVPPPAAPSVIPSSVPTGINIQQMAAKENKTPGQVLDELQKQQMQALDDQAAAGQAQPQ
jgi:hypothetical protein